VNQLGMVGSQHACDTIPESMTSYIIRQRVKRDAFSRTSALSRASEVYSDCLKASLCESMRQAFHVADSQTTAGHQDNGLSFAFTKIFDVWNP